MVTMSTISNGDLVLFIAGRWSSHLVRWFAAASLISLLLQRAILILTGLLSFVVLLHFHLAQKISCEFRFVWQGQSLCRLPIHDHVWLVSGAWFPFIVTYCHHILDFLVNGVNCVNLLMCCRVMWSVVTMSTISGDDLELFTSGLLISHRGQNTC